MATRETTTFGLDHPTVNPHANADSTSDSAEQSSLCECYDCEYTVDVNEELPPKCPRCDGALVRATE